MPPTAVATGCSAVNGDMLAGWLTTLLGRNDPRQFLGTLYLDDWSTLLAGKQSTDGQIQRHIVCVALQYRVCRGWLVEQYDMAYRSSSITVYHTAVHRYGNTSLTRHWSDGVSHLWEVPEDGGVLGHLVPLFLSSSSSFEFVY